MILDMFGMGIHVNFTRHHVQADLFGAIHCAKIQNVVMDFILNQMEIVSLCRKDALLQTSGMVPNALKEALVQKVHFYKEIIVCPFNLAKMDLYGIQFISDVFALLARSIVQIDVLNVETIKNGFLELVVLAQMVLSIVEHHARW